MSTNPFREYRAGEDVRLPFRGDEDVRLPRRIHYENDLPCGGGIIALITVRARYIAALATNPPDSARYQRAIANIEQGMREWKAHDGGTFDPFAPDAFDVWRENCEKNRRIREETAKLGQSPVYSGPKLLRRNDDPPEWIERLKRRPKKERPKPRPKKDNVVRIPLSPEQAALAELQNRYGLDRERAQWIIWFRKGYALAEHQEIFCRKFEEHRASIEARRLIDGDDGDPKPKERPKPPEFKLIPFLDIRFNPAVPYVVEGIIPRNGLVTTWGPPKCGKSFWMFDLAMRVALGWPYRGCKVKQGAVVYCAAEGGIGFANRVEAWRQRFLPEDPDPIPFYLLATPMDLIADHPALITTIEKQAGDDVPVMVVLDTLNRTLVGSENRPEDMAKYIRATDAIRMAFGCAVPVIHHCGIEGTRPRGHSSLAGADDCQIAVSRDSSGLIKVEVEHLKDGIPAKPFACRLEPVEIGISEDGGPATSCVVVESELTQAAKARGTKVSANQQRFLDILADAILDAPDPQKTTYDISGGRTAISREWLKQCLVTKGWLDDGDSADQKRLKVNNMLNLLAGKRLVGTSNLFVWDAR